MTFTWTRDGERITSTCPRCLARVSSRQEPVIRAWQRNHDPVACIRRARENNQKENR